MRRRRAGAGRLAGSRRTPLARRRTSGPRPDGAAVDLVVLHSISLPPGAVRRRRRSSDCSPTGSTGTRIRTTTTIRGLQVSAHFLIRRNGELVQFVVCDDRAWHAGRVVVARARGRATTSRSASSSKGSKARPSRRRSTTPSSGSAARSSARYPIAAVAGHEHVAPGPQARSGPGLRLGERAARPLWTSRSVRRSCACSATPDRRGCAHRRAMLAAAARIVAQRSSRDRLRAPV